VRGGERAVVRDGEVGDALLMRDEFELRRESRRQPSMPHMPSNVGAAAATATLVAASRALVSECHKAIPGQVQTRSSAGVACVILTQVTLKSFATHDGVPTATLRSVTRRAGAVRGSEGAVVRDGEVGRALLMRDEIPRPIECDACSRRCRSGH